MIFTKYIIKLITWLLIPYIAGLLLLLIVFPQYYFNAYPTLIIVFVFMALPFFNVLKINGKGNQRKFFTLFIGNTFFKLFLSLTLIVLYALFIKTQLIAFILSYFIFYVILSVFEIKTFTQIIKRENNAN